MHCFTVGLYPLGDGRHALQFDLLLPLPQQEDYLVKVRDKNSEIARQTAATQRRQRSCPLLETSGRLQVNDTLHLVKLSHPAFAQLSLAQREATYLGAGRVRWQSEEYSSLTDLTVTIRNMVEPKIITLAGTDFWGLEVGGLSLAQLANNVPTLP